MQDHSRSRISRVRHPDVPLCQLVMAIARAFTQSVIVYVLRTYVYVLVHGYVLSTINHLPPYVRTTYVRMEVPLL